MCGGGAGGGAVSTQHGMTSAEKCERESGEKDSRVQTDETPVNSDVIPAEQLHSQLPCSRTYTLAVCTPAAQGRMQRVRVQYMPLVMYAHMLLKGGLCTYATQYVDYLI